MSGVRTGVCVIAVAFLVLGATGCGGYASGSKSSNKTTVTLGQQNGSGETGTATLTKVGNKTKVVVDLQGASAMVAAQPAHIHKGSCAKLNPTPEFPLANVQSGKSTTTVDVSLDTLKGAAYAINVHKSATHLKTYVACGNIGSGKSGGSGGGGYKY